MTLGLLTHLLMFNLRMRLMRNDGHTIGKLFSVMNLDTETRVSNGELATHTVRGGVAGLLQGVLMKGHHAYSMRPYRSTRMVLMMLTRMRTAHYPELGYAIVRQLQNVKGSGALLGSGLLPRAQTNQAYAIEVVGKRIAELRLLGKGQTVEANVLFQVGLLLLLTVKDGSRGVRGATTTLRNGLRKVNGAHTGVKESGSAVGSSVRVVVALLVSVKGLLGVMSHAIRTRPHGTQLTRFLGHVNLHALTSTGSENGRNGLHLEHRHRSHVGGLLNVLATRETSTLETVQRNGQAMGRARVVMGLH